MRIRTVVGVGALLAAGVGVVVVVSGGDPPDGATESAAAAAVIEAAVVPAAAEAIHVIDADPDPDSTSRTWLDLDLPETAEPGAQVTGAVTWTSSSGTPISGQVDIQRAEGAEWATVASAEVVDGTGGVELDIEATAIYRAVYEGSDQVQAARSTEATVQAGDLLASTLSVAVAPGGDEGFQVTASWATPDAVAVRGALEVQQEIDGEWTSVAQITTGDSGSGNATVDADETSMFRLVYPGGARFAPIESDPAAAVGADVRTIPVSACSTDHEIDNLPNGQGCHFTPVQSGTFVVAHDYLGNSWWNAMPMGSVVELEGEQAGIYEVVDRVMAPGRGAALGSASNWTCGDACDVVLQTCQGSNTGFTWLREVSA